MIFTVKPKNMKIQIDLVRLTTYNISADEYTFLLLRLLGKTVPKIISDRVNLVSLQQREFIKIVEGGFAKRPKLTKLFASVLESSKVEDWIDDWRYIWPSGVKSGGKLVRGSKADCTKKMKMFLARTNYTKDEVFAAATAYVLERKHHRYNYMSLANYFIKKDDDSPLEAWCEQLKEDGDRETSYGEFHKEI